MIKSSRYQTRAIRSQIFRYGVFGVALNSIGYAAYIGLTYLGLYPKLVMSLLYISGVAISFWTSRNHVFYDRGSVTNATRRYLLAHCLGYLLNLSILTIMVDRFAFPHQWVQAAAVVIVAGYLFIACRFYVFSSGTTHASHNR